MIEIITIPISTVILSGAGLRECEALRSRRIPTPDPLHAHIAPGTTLPIEKA
jgi:hypothetical protein